MFCPNFLEPKYIGLEKKLITFIPDLYIVFCNANENALSVINLPVSLFLPFNPLAFIHFSNILAGGRFDVYYKEM